MAMYERIRGDERMAILPIVLISGFVTKDDITIAKTDPHSRFLVKPFTEEILLTIIKRSHIAGVKEREEDIAAGGAVVQSAKDIAAAAINEATVGGKNDLGLMVQKGPGQGSEWTTTQARENLGSGPNVRISRDAQPDGEFEFHLENPAVGGNYDHRMSAHAPLNDMEIRQQRDQGAGEFSIQTHKEVTAATGSDLKVSADNHLQDFEIRQERPAPTASGGVATQSAAPTGAEWTMRQSVPAQVSGGEATQKSLGQGTEFEFRQQGHNVAPVAGLQPGAPAEVQGLDDLVFIDDVDSIERDLQQAGSPVTAPGAEVGVADQPVTPPAPVGAAGTTAARYQLLR